MIQLPDEQLACYREQGYLQIDALTTADEVERIKTIYDRLFASKAGRDIGDQFDLAGADDNGDAPKLPQLMNPARYAPELDDLAFRANALAIARQLLAPEAEPGDEHAILKLAGYGVATPWHQDEAYWDPTYEYEALSVWMPLQPATIENGCMQFVPGSHRMDIQPHQSIGGDPRVHGLEIDKSVDVSNALACPLPTGGCTIHHCKTLHYAGPNNSDVPRRAYILIFQLPPRKRDTPRRFPWLDIRETARQERARLS